MRLFIFACAIQGLFLLPDVSSAQVPQMVVGKSVTGHYDVPGGDTPEGKPVSEKLNSIMIPAISFKEQDISDVLSMLSQRSKELDPQHIGVQIRLNLTPIPHTISHTIRRRISLDLQNSSLAEVLALMCERTRTGYLIENGEVVVRPLLSY